MKKETYDNPRYPHNVTITRIIHTEDPFEGDEETVTTLYSGVGRVFTDTTTTGNADMDVNRRKCSIPVRYDEWEREILDGDSIAVTIGNFEYSGVVRDFEPDNNRTLVYWERYRVTD